MATRPIRPKIYPKPPFLGVQSQADIDEMNAHIAAGSMGYTIGSTLTRSNDGRTLTLEGVGLEASFRAPSTDSGGGDNGGGGGVIVVPATASFGNLEGSPEDNIPLSQALAGFEPALPEGTSSQYIAGDKTIQDIPTVSQLANDGTATFAMLVGISAYLRTQATQLRSA